MKKIKPKSRKPDPDLAQLQQQIDQLQQQVVALVEQVRELIQPTPPRQRYGCPRSTVRRIGRPTGRR